MTTSLGDIWVWHYTLQSKAVLNARFESLEHRGALIRDFGGGVGCIHPWTSLGDASLEDQLASLASGHPLPLAEQALVCAEFDGLARRDGVNLFDKLTVPIPKSHWTASPAHDPASVVGEGFGAVKIKCGPDMTVNRSEIERWQTAGPDLRLRLDFNETGTVDALTGFWGDLAEPDRGAIEFIEDPVPWDKATWQELRKAGIPLAADRDALGRADEADWLVVKPGAENPVRAGEKAYETGSRLVFTSYMDHAIGQVYAAFRAGEWAGVFPEQVSECGLLTHELFEPDPFFERLCREGPQLLPPTGTGLGFDDLLESLPWKKMT